MVWCDKVRAQHPCIIPKRGKAASGRREGYGDGYHSYPRCFGRTVGYFSSRVSEGAAREGTRLCRRRSHTILCVLEVVFFCFFVRTVLCRDVAVNLSKAHCRCRCRRHWKEMKTGEGFCGPGGINQGESPQIHTYHT